MCILAIQEWATPYTHGMPTHDIIMADAPIITPKLIIIFNTTKY